MAKRPLIMRVEVPDEPTVDDGSSDVVVSVECQGERHQVRLTSRGQLSFDHHDDLSTLTLVAEAAALAKMPQVVRCAEILLVWRYWYAMEKHFPGAPRPFGLPSALLPARASAQRRREDRAKRRAHEHDQETYQAKRVRAARLAQLYRQRGTVLRPDIFTGEPL